MAIDLFLLLRKDRMASKRRRTDESNVDSSSGRKPALSKSSKKPPRVRRSDPGDVLDAFSINLDQAELGQWLSEAEGLLWGTSGFADADAEVAKARAKLTRSPDNVEAYLTLADHAADDRAALPLYEKAVAAGERAIGRANFARLAGRFWSEPKTRPYMHARLSLARCLWALSRRDESLSHANDLLRLNPIDNQGVRYVLLNNLIALDRFDDARALIRKYDEPSAAWAFSKVLVAFHNGGDSPTTRDALKAARRINKHVVPYLLGQKAPPESLPGLYRPGDKSEAAVYLEESFGTWRQVPGALTWLRSVASAEPQSRRLSSGSGASKRRQAAARGTGPTLRAKKKLRKLPLKYGTVWQVTIESFRQPGEADSSPEVSWMILVVNEQTGQLIVQDVVEAKPTAALLWDRLIDAMENPVDGAPCRPSEIQTRPDDVWQALEPHLQEIEVDVIPREKLEQLDELVSQMHLQLRGVDNRGGMIDGDELPDAGIARLYAAAAEFNRRRPWHFVPSDAVLRVEGSAVGARPRYCVVMGQSAMTFGLSIYHSVEQIRAVFSGGCGGCDDDDCDDADCDESKCQACDQGSCSSFDDNLTPLGSTLAVIYDTADTMSAGDLAAIERHGWPVAGPEAYPTIYRTTAQLTAEPATAADLRLLAACLIAIPGFAARHPFDRGDSPSEEFSFLDGDQPLTLAISWVREDNDAGD
jgi:tetratricopeptide (TPR) repeat protein